MSVEKRHVLVTGATGQQGGSVVSALLERGYRVRALVRDPASKGAQALAARGVELARGDFERPETITEAAKGTDAAFVVGTPFTGGPEVETRQGVAAIDAVRAAGVGHVVYSSVADANRATGIPHFDSKYRVEQHLAATGTPSTIVAPVFFMENFHAPWAGLADGKLVLAMPAARKLQSIDVRSIGRFAAVVLEGRDAFFGKRFDIASDERTGDEAAAILSGALGKPIQYVALPPDALRAQSEDMALMFEWFDKVGYSADVPALRRDYPDVGWRTLAEWAATWKTTPAA